MKVIAFIPIVLLLVFSSCKTARQATASSQEGGKYSEDLSSLRPPIEEPKADHPQENTTTKRDPKAYVEPHYTVNKQVDAVLDSIDRINLTRKYVDGFTIQVYSGLKREDALNVKKNMTTYLSKYETEVQYVQPNFRVKTGKYFNRLEAQKDFDMIKRFFPDAIIVPDKIAIN